MTTEQMELELLNQSRIIATINHINGSLTGKCVFHAPSIEQVQQSYNNKFILGYVTAKDLPEIKETLYCNICASRLGLRYNKESNRIY